MKEQITIPNLKVGMLLTTFSISGFAHTVRSEIKITDILSNQVIFSPKGKRKKYYLKVENDTLVFEGWDLPIKDDYAVFSNMFMGNAKLNLGGMEPEELKKFILEKNINPKYNDYSRIRYVTKSIPSDSKENYSTLFSASEIPETPRELHGADGLYNYSMGLVVTSGVKAVADANECYWFLDIIASVQYMPEVQAEEHQTWKLEHVSGSACKATMEDGNYNVIYKQNIQHSSFRGSALTFFLINKTILLPSEN